MYRIIMMKMVEFQTENTKRQKSNVLCLEVQKK